jgi:hypothetical protein
MTTEEGNKLIAEFDGWTIENRDEFNRPSKLPFARKATPYTILLLENLKYHSSWDWLIPACHKWDELEGFVRGEESDQYENLCDFLDSKVTLYEILPVWEQLVKAIEWYNQSKNTQS